MSSFCSYFIYRLFSVTAAAPGAPFTSPGTVLSPALAAAAAAAVVAAANATANGAGGSSPSTDANAPSRGGPM